MDNNSVDESRLHEGDWRFRGEIRIFYSSFVQEKSGWGVRRRGFELGLGPGKWEHREEKPRFSEGEELSIGRGPFGAS